ncbi:hypothetical protein M752DRAFT_266237 [Aspergillus phoenicis ATCC 13157]|uniref:Uncharacterized protein n=1 Tax=Aspergillus phoenicis ATCC 13157 TaxID=1353007 RepID=A0A370PJR8_ASPPH|nr:hypothetical protein M752DRAFT_266237 [Aspergillus phoenicis ATCC 13157]
MFVQEDERALFVGGCRKKNKKNDRDVTRTRNHCHIHYRKAARYHCATRPLLMKMGKSFCNICHNNLYDLWKIEHSMFLTIVVYLLSKSVQIYYGCCAEKCVGSKIQCRHCATASTRCEIVVPFPQRLTLSSPNAIIR